MNGEGTARDERPITAALVVSALLHLLLFILIRSGISGSDQVRIYVPIRVVEESLALPVTGESPPLAEDKPAPAVVEPQPVEETVAAEPRPEVVLAPRVKPKPVEASRISQRPVRGVEPLAEGSSTGRSEVRDHPAAGATTGQREGPGEGDTGSPVAMGPSRAPSIPKSLANQGVVRAEVVFRVMVKEDGTPGEVELVKSSGHEQLDRQAARELIEGRWRFKARVRGGKPVADWVEVTIKFE